MTTSDAKGEANKRLAETICRRLEARGFTAAYVESAQEACDVAAEMIEDGALVGIPGTVTVRETGLPERLEEKGCKIAEHWTPGLSAEERKKALLSELEADWLVTSANAIAADGTIVNIDGTGNRVAAISWSPGKLLFIIGINKITPDVESAIKRAHTTATPPNAIRLGRKTPCAETGLCANCNSPDRLCRVVSLLERAPIGRDCRVLLVGEELGY